MTRRYDSILHSVGFFLDFFCRVFNRVAGFFGGALPFAAGQDGTAAEREQQREQRTGDSGASIVRNSVFQVHILHCLNSPLFLSGLNPCQMVAESRAIRPERLARRADHSAQVSSRAYAIDERSTLTYVGDGRPRLAYGE